MGSSVARMMTDGQYFAELPNITVVRSGGAYVDSKDPYEAGDIMYTKARNEPGR